MKVHEQREYTSNSKKRTSLLWYHYIQDYYISLIDRENIYFTINPCDKFLEWNAMNEWWVWWNTKTILISFRCLILWLPIKLGVIITYTPGRREHITTFPNISVWLIVTCLNSEGLRLIIDIIHKAVIFIFELEAFTFFSTFSNSVSCRLRMSRLHVPWGAVWLGQHRDSSAMGEHR